MSMCTLLITNDVYITIGRTMVDETKKQMTALSPCPGRLPANYLVVGNLKWIEK